MSSLDISRLSKILSLLGSPHEGEALAAARRAHAIVSGSGSSWLDILSNAAIADVPHIQASTMPDGRRLTPPVGRTWHDTAMYLLPFLALMPLRTSKFILRMTSELKSPFAFISPADAERLCSIYRDISSGQQ